MRRVRVELDAGGYDVIVGSDCLAEVASVLEGRRRVAIVSQAAIADHWVSGILEPLADQGISAECFVMGDGEEMKSLHTLEDLTRKLATWGLLRDDAIVALGGGVVTDTAGFIAATYCRGVAWTAVPTTLLGQVDAAIGGKTGVNLPEGKNLVGAFHQPLGVVADVTTLMTLPEREYRSGLGEVAKYAFLGDDELARLLINGGGIDGTLARRDPEAMEEVVGLAAAAKARVVSADEREQTGLRATLNYGHTLAHAIETAGQYGMLHGEAVAVGCVFAAELARALGRIEDHAVAHHREVLAALDLPTSAPEGCSSGKLVDVMRRDKKAKGGLTFVLLSSESGAEIVHDPPEAAVFAAMRSVGINE